MLIRQLCRFKRRTDLNRLTLLADCRRHANEAANHACIPESEVSSSENTPRRGEKQSGGIDSPTRAILSAAKSSRRGGAPNTGAAAAAAAAGAPKPQPGSNTGLAKGNKAGQQPGSNSGGGLFKRVPTGALGLPLQLRDIRCVQSISEPVLFVRKGAIVIAMGPYRAVITKSTAFLLQPSERALQPLLQMLTESLRQDRNVKLPFELCVLEAIIVLAIQAYVAEVDHVSELMRTVLKDLRQDITAVLLNEAYALKGRVGRALQQVCMRVCMCVDEAYALKGRVGRSSCAYV
jgi:hypothetical protein